MNGFVVLVFWFTLKYAVNVHSRETDQIKKSAFERRHFVSSESLLLKVNQKLFF